MWFQGILLFLGFTGVIADVGKDTDKCLEILDMEKLDKMATMKSSEEMDVVCPMVPKFLTCLEDAVKAHTGVTLAKLAELTAGTKNAVGPDLVYNMKTVLDELCTEGSPLNKDYKDSMKCFDGLEGPFENCDKKAADLFETDVDEKDRLDDIYSASQCMQTAYSAACYGSLIHDNCGKNSFDTYTALIKRSTMFKNGLCSKRGIEKIKKTFLKSLNKRKLKRLESELIRGKI